MGTGFLCGTSWRPGTAAPSKLQGVQTQALPSSAPDPFALHTPSPLTAGHADMAARLRALAPTRMPEQERRRVFCELLHRIDCDPAVRAITEHIANYNAPAREYALNDSIVITEHGARFAHGANRLSADVLMAHPDATLMLRAMPQGDLGANGVARMEASVAARVGAIGEDLIAHLSGSL